MFDLYDYNWFGFVVAFVLTVIIPVWVIDLVEIKFLMRLAFTVAGGLTVFFVVARGKK